MTLRRWEPFSEMMSLRQAMERLFEDSFIRPPGLWPTLAEAGHISMDMYETPESVVVKASLPGIKPEDVSLTITGDTLAIKGEVKQEETVKEEHYMLREGHAGSFSRAVSLPGSLDTDKAEASFEHGILTLTIPKRPEAKPKSIKVQVRSPKGK